MTKKKNRHWNLYPEIVRCLYWEHNFNLYDIGKFLGWSHSKIRCFMIAHNVPLKEQKKYTRNKYRYWTLYPKIVRCLYWEHHFSVANIGVFLGHPYAAIRRFMIAHNVPRRENKNSITIEKRRAASKKAMADPLVRAKISKSMVLKWKTPEYRDKLLKILNSPERRAKMSKNVSESMKIRNNSPERKKKLDEFRKKSKELKKAYEKAIIS